MPKKLLYNFNKMDLFLIWSTQRKNIFIKRAKKDKDKEDDADYSTIDEIEEAINKINFKINKIEEEDEGIKYEL